MIYYDPSEEDSGLLKPGVYKAEISECHETVSKNGRDMWVISFEVDDHVIKDFIVPTSFGLRRLRKLAEAFGELEEYKSGDFNPTQCIGRTLMVKVTVEESQDYGKQNRISEYKPLEKNSDAGKQISFDEETEENKDGTPF